MLLMAVILVGCSVTDDLLDRWRDLVGGHVGDDGPMVGGMAGAPANLLDCGEHGDQPCSYADVDDDVLLRTHALARAASGLLAGFSVDEVAVELARQDQVAAVAVTERSVGFRLHGGRAVWVVQHDAEGQRLLSAGASSMRVPAADADRPSSRGRLVTVGSSSALGAPGVTGDVGEGKRTLVLAPYHWEFAAFEYTADDAFTERVRGRLTNERDWRPDRGGTIDVRANRQPFEGDDEVLPAAVDTADLQRRRDAAPVDGDVDLSHFEGWDAYDHVLVMTHGSRICGDPEDESTCVVALSTGSGILLEPDATEVTDEHHQQLAMDDVALVYAGHAPDREVRSRCAEKRRDAAVVAFAEAVGVQPPVDVDMVALEQAVCTFDLGPPRASIALLPSWFERQYPDGLGGSLVALVSCEAMRYGDYDHLAGEDGFLLGFTRVISDGVGKEVTDRIVDGLVRGQPFERIVRDIQATMSGAPIRIAPFDDVPDDPGEREGIALSIGSPGDLTLSSAGEAVGGQGRDVLRGRDIVSAHHATGSELTDGDLVELRATDEGPALSLVLGLQGIDEQEEQPTDFALEVRIDGEPIDGRWQVTEHIGDGEYRTEEIEIPAPDHVLDGTPFTLEVETTLPRGGVSRWRYERLEVEHDLAIRLRSLVEYHTEPLLFRSRIAGTAPLERGDDGSYRGVGNLDWTEITIDLADAPAGCSVDRQEMRSSLEIVAADIDADAGEARVAWRIVQGEDRLSVNCGGVPLALMGALAGTDVDADMAVGQGIGGIYIALDGGVERLPGSPDVVRATDFVPSPDDEVLLVFTSTTTLPGVTATVWLEVVVADLE